MLACQLSINRQPAGAFGFEDWSVLHASRLNPADEFALHTGGVARDREPVVEEGVRLFKAALAPGAEVALRILNAAKAGPPIKRYRSDKTAREAPLMPEENLPSEREEYERPKARSGPGS
jgi:hypothetical protein